MQKIELGVECSCFQTILHGDGPMEIKRKSRGGVSVPDINGRTSDNKVQVRRTEQMGKTEKDSQV
jgi:hypothetical protein